MYFKILPNIIYDEKPIKYPFSNSDKVVANNFFRRYKLNDDIFDYAVYFNKYAILDGERPDSLAQKLYGNPNFDWVILLTNNMVNAQYDWPMSNRELSLVLEKEFTNPFAEIMYYRTIEIGTYKKGMRVDETFYNKQHKINVNGTIVLKNGSEISSPVSVAQHYMEENEKKREIYLLKSDYFQSFVADFKKRNQYSKDENYVNKKLKATG